MESKVSASVILGHHQGLGLLDVVIPRIFITLKLGVDLGWFGLGLLGWFGLLGWGQAGWVGVMQCRSRWDDILKIRGFKNPWNLQMIYEFVIKTRPFAFGVVCWMIFGIIFWRYLQVCGAAFWCILNLQSLSERQPSSLIHGKENSRVMP